MKKYFIKPILFFGYTFNSISIGKPTLDVGEDTTNTASFRAILNLSDDKTGKSGFPSKPIAIPIAELPSKVSDYGSIIVAQLIAEKIGQTSQVAIELLPVE